MKHTEESKLKISIATKGRVAWNKGLKTGPNPEHSKRMKGRSVWNKGKKGLQTWSEYQREVMSKLPKGENHPKFTGTNLAYYKNKVKIRDDYTCQICEFRDIEIMQVDHILPVSKFPDLKLNMDNMRVLCPNCHARKTIREKRKIASIKSVDGLA